MNHPIRTETCTHVADVIHGNMGLQAAVTEYLDYLQTVARRSPLTMQGDRTDYKRFLSFLGDQGDLPLAEVTPQLVERYTASLRHLSDASLSCALNALSSLFRWAVRFDYAKANPLDKVQRPRKKHKVQPCPSPAEVSALLDATKGPTERAALLAMATSGLRRAELLGLDWSAVDLPTRRLRILGKGDKQKEVAIFEELLAALHPCPQAHPLKEPHQTVERQRLSLPSHEQGPVCHFAPELQPVLDHAGHLRQKRNEPVLHALPTSRPQPTCF